MPPHELPEPRVPGFVLQRLALLALELRVLQNLLLDFPDLVVLDRLALLLARARVLQHRLQVPGLLVPHRARALELVNQLGHARIGRRRRGRILLVEPADDGVDVAHHALHEAPGLELLDDARERAEVLEAIRERLLVVHNKRHLVRDLLVFELVDAVALAAHVGGEARLEPREAVVVHARDGLDAVLLPRELRLDGAHALELGFRRGHHDVAHVCRGGVRAVVIYRFLDCFLDFFGLWLRCVILGHAV